MRRLHIYIQRKRADRNVLYINCVFMCSCSREPVCIYICGVDYNPGWYMIDKHILHVSAGTAYMRNGHTLNIKHATISNGYLRWAARCRKFE